MDATTYDPFPIGLVVFFRTIDKKTGQLASSVHPNARRIALRASNAHPEDYIIIDAEGKVIGLYPRDWVACILPLQPGPNTNAADQQNRLSDSPSSATGNTKGFIGRA